uniref:Ubiquitin-like domain-containing protein n=1 Tax=Megaselia scalaris TaxID=36166 RepID=T1GT46_MEGSC
MKIRVKNLQQETHEIEIDPNSSVRDLKTAIFNQLGSLYNTENQTLIYAGTILQDDQPIKTYNIDEKKFIVCLVKTKNPSSTASSPVRQPQETPATDTPQFLQHIHNIMEMGYSESQARGALEV